MASLPVYFQGMLKSLLQKTWSVCLEARMHFPLVRTAEEIEAFSAVPSLITEIILLLFDALRETRYLRKQKLLREMWEWCMSGPGNCLAKPVHRDENLIPCMHTTKNNLHLRPCVLVMDSGKDCMQCNWL